MTTSRTTAPRSFSDHGSARRRRSLVSLTPLIDVVFILLLFFMLASSFVDLRSITLDTPAAGGGAPSIEGALLIEVRVDGVRFAGRYLSLDDLAARIRGQLARQPHRRVLVRPAAGVDLQATVRVLDRLSNAGVRNLSLMDQGASGGGGG